ncbi:hypothetical protein Goshw_010537 [Gossypium schwendimanii]|uniref:Thioredoxin domain-containing protein n=1 Tax=Gossypium schwendimanii TaxID=34291 RepID=A0A7J9LVG6_GOSSC|nr:hypothetical protein [Gossypium schwendimanii]
MKKKRKTNWITLNPNHFDPTPLTSRFISSPTPRPPFQPSFSLSLQPSQLSEGKKQSTLFCSKSSLLVHFGYCVMASSSLKCGSYFSGFNETMLSSHSKKASWFSTSSTSLDSKASSSSKKFPVLTFDFWGKPLVVPDQNGSRNCTTKPENKFSVQAETNCVSRCMRWWEKNLKPNMVKIHSAQELVCSLQNAGDRLVIIDFYSPGCGGCKALHPKICQLAEQNPNAIFLEVNYEELKKMCQCLNIHVLPFFRFYKGAEGRVSSFSCTNATIKKFKAALAKHGSDECSLGPAKGLDESEVMKLVSAGELSLSSLQSPSLNDSMVMRTMELSGILNKADNNRIMLQKEGALL